MKDVDGTLIEDFDMDEAEELQERSEETENNEEVIQDLLIDEEVRAAAETATPEEEDDYDEDDEDPYDGYEDDEEDEAFAINPFLVVLIVLCMILLAAGITTIIWNIKHPERKVGALLRKGNKVTLFDTGLEILPDDGEPVVVIEAYADPGANKLPLPSYSKPEPEELEESEAEPTGEIEIVTDSAEGMVDGQMQNPVVEETDENGEPVPVVIKDTVLTKEGKSIPFVAYDDIVTPRYYADLRTEPSTFQGNDSIICRVNAGDLLHRIGVSQDGVWTCVEWSGMALYVNTGFMDKVESLPEPEAVEQPY